MQTVTQNIRPLRNDWSQNIIIQAKPEQAFDNEVLGQIWKFGRLWVVMEKSQPSHIAGAKAHRSETTAVKAVR
jgi:hypothetical protein